MEEIVITEEDLEADRVRVQKEYLKATKAKSIENSQVEINGVKLNANTKAQTNLSATGTIANWQFNKNLKDTFNNLAKDPNTSLELKTIAKIISSIYDGVYLNQTLNWKTADNALKEINGEEVLNALHLTMLNIGKITTEEK